MLVPEYFHSYTSTHHVYSYIIIILHSQTTFSSFILIRCLNTKEEKASFGHARLGGRVILMLKG